MNILSVGPLTCSSSLVVATSYNSDLSELSEHIGKQLGALVASSVHYMEELRSPFMLHSGYLAILLCKSIPTPLLQASESISPGLEAIKSYRLSELRCVQSHKLCFELSSLQASLVSGPLIVFMSTRSHVASVKIRVQMYIRGDQAPL